MTLAAFNGQATDLLGNVLTTFQVEVRHDTAGLQLATIYSDRAGVTPLGNPFTPDPSDNGHFRFHAAGGPYRIRAFDSAGNERIWRYVAIGLAAESDDAIQFPGFLMTFDDDTTQDNIADGEIRANNASLASATELYISVNDVDGNSIQDRLLELGDPTKTERDTIILAQSGAQASFRVVSVAVGSPALYVIVTVTAHDGDTTLEAGGNTSLQLALCGEDGADGADGAGDVNGPGASTAGQFAVFSNTSGKQIEGEDLGDSPSTPITLGSAAGVRAATPGGLVHQGLIEDASAPVALTDAATIALDWDTFINGTVTLTANRTLGNPTNGQPGTWRTVLVQGDAATSPATDRTLTFGNQYKGDIPTLNDIDDHQWYLLMIYCVTSTHFVVSAKEAKDNIIL